MILGLGERSLNREECKTVSSDQRVSRPPHNHKNKTSRNADDLRLTHLCPDTMEERLEPWVAGRGLDAPDRQPQLRAGPGCPRQAALAQGGAWTPQTGSPSSGLCPLPLDREPQLRALPPPPDRQPQLRALSPSPRQGAPSSEGARREQVRKRFLKAGSLPGHRPVLV